ncbi:MAG: peptidoglycan recognition protein family protein [Minisyncoccia bacterium]
MFDLKKYLLTIIILITLIFFAVLLSHAKIYLYSQKTKNQDQQKEKYADNLEIPSHINLTDFYQTYGERLLGDEKLKIISREEWGADNNYANPEFINKLCEKIRCSLEEYNPENSFLEEEYLKARSLLINYRNNFEKFDDLFLQTKRKENGINYQYLPVEEIIIHHTAGKFTQTYEDSIKEVQRIYLLHAVLRRWRDIGYHFLIDSEGRIFEGTLGGKYSVGAHTYYHNKGTIGIALMGDFRKNHDQMTEEMKDSLIKLILYLKKEYKWDFSQKELYLKKPDLSGREISDKFIKGHKELNIRLTPTSCPGIDPQELRNLIYPFLFSQ